MFFGLVRMWLHDLLRGMPTGHNDVWATENKTIRSSEFLYETSFDYKRCIFKILLYIYIFTDILDNIYIYA